MPDTIRFLNTEEGYIETGVIEEKLGDQFYRVKIGSQSHSIKAAVSQPMKRGNSVIINRTAIGRYIVGSTESLKSKQVKEIVING